jgi:hypothetical protein
VLAALAEARIRGAEVTATGIAQPARRPQPSVASPKPSAIRPCASPDSAPRTTELTQSITALEQQVVDLQLELVPSGDHIL